MRAVACGALLACGAVLVPSAPVHACEIPAACPDTYAAPGAGRAIPANAPALFFQRGDGPDDGSNGPVDLVTVGGDPLPFSLVDDPANPPGGRLLIPAAPLPEGTIRFRTAACGPETDFFIDNSFTVTSPSPLPTAIGTVSVGASAPVSVPNGLCDFMGLVRPVGVTWTLDPTPALEAFWALTQLTLKVDGAVWSRERYGRGRSLGSTEDKVDLVYAECAPHARPDAGPPRGVAPGRHRGELSAHIAGMEGDLPAIAFDFDIDCTPPADAGTTDVPTRENPGARSGGCQVGHGGPESPPAAIAFAIALFAAVLPLRRKLSSRRKMHRT